MSDVLRKSSIIILLFAFSFLSCNENSVDSFKYKSTGKKAIVIVVEDFHNNYPGIEYYFLAYKNEMLNMFSTIFLVERSKLEHLSLYQIIDIFGEEWQINQIKSQAIGHYDEIISLTDDTAVKEIFLDTLRYLSDNNYTIDLILNLHGSPTTVVFNDGSHNVNELTNQMNNRNISIRCLYQTCCQSAPTIPIWTEFGIQSVNGTQGNNSIVLFSASFFLQNWIAGQDYSGAVNKSYLQEINQLQSYREQIPYVEAFLNPTVLEDSKQFTGGINKYLLWNQIPY